MCHDLANAGLPQPSAYRDVEDDGLHALAFGPLDAATRLAILPDIYGPGVFYQQLATHFAALGATVYLMNPFHDLGELHEQTREAAFARRGRLRDRTYVDGFEAFAKRNGVTGVAGFCLGGLYVYELARRRLPAALVGLYGFPQGLPNDDPLPVPFDYLAGLDHPHVSLFGDQDHSQTAASLARLAGISARTAGFDLHVFPGSGHGFLADLASDDPVRAGNAEAALAIVERTVLTEAAVA